MSAPGTGESAAGQRQNKTDQAAAVQRRAADPRASIWVGASAGTGKTKVLTDRVLSLMLQGGAPGRILCLTFTKAAAAEMNNRLAETLMLWATGSRSDVEAWLAELLGRAPDEALLARARQLFAAVLDVPGGMKIQTIHAFCQSLLGRFPLEAEVAPQFRLLDELGANDWLRDAQERVLARAGLADHEDLAAAVEVLTGHVNELDFAAVLAELVGERGRLKRLLRHYGSLSGLSDALARRLGVAPGESVEAIIDSACADATFDAIGLKLASAALEGGGKSDQETGRAIAAWLAAGEERRVLWRDYLGAYFTGGGQGARRKTLAHKATLAIEPAADEILAHEAERLARVCDRVNAARLLEATEALLRLGAAILEVYEMHKRAHALLDYDDLILKARDLLQREGVSPWVLYKLDGGLDHLLIDEAQDTNPEQWEVIAALTEEFFVGEGAHEDRDPEHPRTVFAVGDAKQSIYSFQRADPSQFAAMRRLFRARALAAHQSWDEVDLTHSFRSTASVLQAVDAVFGRSENQAGVVFEKHWLDHDPVRVGQAGLVELWPPVDPEDDAELAPWAPPLARSDAAEPSDRLARLIASRIESWTRTQTSAPGEDSWLASQARQIRPDDILVLVRRRNDFVDELVRELKHRRVPVAGVDRMVLAEQLPVMDLIALGRVLLLPADDLSLAAVLKSPLVGLDEDQLFTLAHGRSGSLWQALKQQADDDPAFAAAADWLGALAARADFVSPYELYAELLADGARRRLLARLGPDAADPLEEFLSLALAYEREETASLEGFLHWIEIGQQEIKRDMDSSGGTVRVMTVHGAKGLQAPIVVLPDTLQVPRQSDRLLWLSSPGAPSELPLWSPRRGLDDPLAAAEHAAARERQDEEHRRLLYVAMTRAEDRLYICGWNTRNSAPEDCWYKRVERALAAGPASAVSFDFSGEIGDGWSGPGWRLDNPQSAEPEGAEAAHLPATPVALTLEKWAWQPAPAEETPPRPLAPSRPRELEPAPRSPLGEDAGRRFRRGRLIHRLLQSLPELPPGERAAAAQRYLVQAAADLEASERAEIAGEVLTVLDDPQFAPLFGPGSRAEVPLTGVVEGRAGPEIISGQIDRIYVDATKVLVLDFKTNRPAPRTEAAVPALYLRQMATYRAVLLEIYPGHEIECALLWTDEPRLMTLDSRLLARHAP
jgi:ATP-dependent helicase/nuclease subunit A